MPCKTRILIYFVALHSEAKLGMVTEFHQQVLSCFFPKLVFLQNLSIFLSLDLFFWWFFLRIRSHGKPPWKPPLRRTFSGAFLCKSTPWKINGWNLQITHEKKGKWSEPNLDDYVQNVNLQECSLNTSPSKSSKSSNELFVDCLGLKHQILHLPIKKSQKGQPVTKVLQTPVPKHPYPSLE